MYVVGSESPCQKFFQTRERFVTPSCRRIDFVYATRLLAESIEFAARTDVMVVSLFDSERPKKGSKNEYVQERR
jgi:hypothetical protein